MVLKVRDLVVNQLWRVQPVHEVGHRFEIDSLAVNGGVRVKSICVMWTQTPFRRARTLGAGIQLRHGLLQLCSASVVVLRIRLDSVRYCPQQTRTKRHIASRYKTLVMRKDVVARE
ncbi:hypothetical protein F441_01310 [Phytophthora nicotianae CJ01A1]|uniref:Uncharacterized protein n=1 Tax=Phytophthora nicotianae CJ01A1 TaxID=1317063 RepID=W2XVD5_PHYNI|nr:hypothetical protein F441_01310 [Phytophthora nicotianae CJ01A1]